MNQKSTAAGAENNGDEKSNLREALAVFQAEKAFLHAVNELELSGFGRRDLSVLADSTFFPIGLGHTFGEDMALADDGKTSTEALVSPETARAAKAASMSFPIYASAVGRFLATAATGSILAFAIPNALAAGVVGGEFGVIGTIAIGPRHRDCIEKKIENGGILLWVRTTAPEKERLATEILRNNGGQNVHIREVTIWSGVDNILLWHVRPELLLTCPSEFK